MCRLWGPKKLQAFALWLFSSEVGLARRCYPGCLCQGLTSANLNIRTLKLYPEPATKYLHSPAFYVLYNIFSSSSSPSPPFCFLCLVFHFVLFLLIIILTAQGLPKSRFPVCLVRVEFSRVVVVLLFCMAASLKMLHFRKEKKRTSWAVCLHTHFLKCYYKSRARFMNATRNQKSQVHIFLWRGEGSLRSPYIKLSLAVRNSNDVSKRSSGNLPPWYCCYVTFVMSIHTERWHSVTLFFF